MLIQDQYIYQSPAIDMPMDTADYNNPEWGCLFDVSLSGVEKLLDLNRQP